MKKIILNSKKPKRIKLSTKEKLQKLKNLKVRELTEEELDVIEIIRNCKFYDSSIMPVKNISVSDCNYRLCDEFRNRWIESIKGFDKQILNVERKGIFGLLTYKGNIDKHKRILIFMEERKIDEIQKTAAEKGNKGSSNKGNVFKGKIKLKKGGKLQKGKIKSVIKHASKNKRKIKRKGN